ncbi:MAG: Kae1-associated kinase Bud32 [Candidatus Helarchaeota archaeon]|nr:Kae1-associated kinase Bud32 [Candidatus Helarchaeota archaeon]
MLYKMGAEAYLYKETWYGRSVLKKVRVSKAYRHPILDQQLRMARTVHEAKIITDTRKLGISTPIIYYVDVPCATILMEFIEGIRVKEILMKNPANHMELFRKIGRIIGTLHKHDIIHGDLTTSNMIVQATTGKIYLIDFGLAEYSTTLESRGVDLHLIRRALQSTHFKILESCFAALIAGYTEILGEASTKEILQRLDDIDQRGRYH